MKPVFPKQNFSVPTLIYLWEIYIFPGSVCLFCWRKYVDRSWEYMNRSQTQECGSWDWGHAIPRKGIHKWCFSLQCGNIGRQISYLWQCRSSYGTSPPPAPLAAASDGHDQLFRPAKRSPRRKSLPALSGPRTSCSANSSPTRWRSPSPACCCSTVVEPAALRRPRRPDLAAGAGPGAVRQIPKADSAVCWA